MADEFHSFYKTVGGGEGARCRYPTRLDMYGRGCQHNCSYCYARSLLEFRGNWDCDNPAEAPRDEVIKVLDSIESGTVLRLGGMTDPFQPKERESHANRWLIQQLNKRGIQYLIVTKGADVLEENIDVLDKGLVHIQISYTYTEGRAPPQFESASAPQDRIRVAEMLQEQGFDVALRLSPYIPQFVDIRKITECRVDKVQVEFLRANAMIRKRMPYYDFTAWNQREAGYQQLSLSAKKMLLKPIIATGKQVSVCEDYTPHYNWFKEHVNQNPDDCCNLRCRKNDKAIRGTYRCDTMEVDVLTIIAVAVSALIGFGIYWFYANYDHKAVDKAFTTIKSLFDAYGDRIKEDKPELYQELKDALDTMERAMTDDEISIMEAYNIAKAFLPLIARVEGFIKEKYL